MTGYERVNRREKYYYVDFDNEIEEGVDDRMPADEEVYNTANYYSSSLVAEENSRADELMRKLRRFAVEHNTAELEWGRNTPYKYSIVCDYITNAIDVQSCVRTRNFGQIYFSSEEIAEQAIEEFKDELLWYFTEYQDHVTEPKKIECKWCGDETKLQAMKVLEYKMCPYCCKELSE